MQDDMGMYQAFKGTNSFTIEIHKANYMYNV